ncbi:Dabb family protein [Fibrella aquatilis]|uniref:Dabb family protein n=1 Tax=Fibrella aquatilis TaxID=2817059 RepID=A0A939GB03_9BACT|nr:Dabb family protein [Fibrella aquatilis]MBO0934498.1 Dabb family protein [Fibrella aquatilis]
MFLHSVYFWLSNPESTDDRAALQAGLESLRGVPAIQASYIGSPAETRRPVIDHSYDLSLILHFADKAAHDVYQDHPIHLEFVAECKHLWSQVKIYDVMAK